VGDGLVGARDVELWWHGRGIPAGWLSATGGARTRERVWRTQGAAAMIVVPRGGPGEVCCGEATRDLGVSTACTCDVPGMSMPFWARGPWRLAASSSTAGDAMCCREAR
jgi:hypothetical protein